MASVVQDTGKFRKNTKDQYYTKLSVAKRCVDAILEKFPVATSYQWVEPSAGNGVFLKAIPTIVNKLGIDLEPKSPDIQQGNFLDWTPNVPGKRIFFGNPPFGRQGSLAKAFIKHAALNAEIIAFILPRSFTKPSMSRAFPMKFHCVFNEEIEKDAFEVNGEEYDVPCVFQIWEKRDVDRALTESEQECGFEYVKPGEKYHIAFRRVGGLAGKCYLSSGAVYNPQSHHFLKVGEEYEPFLEKIVEAVNSHTFPTNTVGPRSLSKSEVNEVLNQLLVAAALSDS